MTLPRLLTIGDVVAENGPDLVKGIRDIIDPNHEFNQQMRLLFIQKPELMQKFVDIEKANPGTLKAFGFNDRGTDLLSGMQESVEGLRSRTTRPDVERVLSDPNARRAVATQEVTGMTPGQLSGDALGEWFTNGGMQLFQSNPQAAMEALQAKFGVQTPTERRMAGLTGEALDAVNTDVELTPGQKTKIVDFGLPQWQSALRSGRLTASQISGALLDPRTKGMAAMALQQQAQERELAQRSWIGIQDDIQREKLRRAAIMFDASGQVGSIDAWYEKANPGQRAPGSTRPVTAEERSAVETASATERMRNQLSTLRSVDATRKQALVDVQRAGTDAEREAAIARLNETLVATDPNMEAYWKVTPWLRGGSDRLSYRNRVTGEDMAPPTQIDTGAVPAAPTTAPTFTADENTALTRWRALRARGQEAQATQELNDFKKRNPQRGAQLEAALGTASQ